MDVKTEAATRTDESAGRPVWSAPSIKDMSIQFDTAGGTIGTADGTNVGSVA